MTTAGGRIAALALLASGIGAADAAVVNGVIRDEQGSIPPRAVVMALTLDDYQTIASAWATDGAFSLSLPDGRDLLLVGIGFLDRRIAGFEVHGYTAATRRVDAPIGTTDLDLTVRRCHEYILVGHRNDGTVVAEGDLRGPFFAVGADGQAATEPLIGVQHAEGGTAPALCVPLGQARWPYVAWELAGAGRLVLPLTPADEPFAGLQHGGEIVDLDLALARTQLDRLERRVAAATDSGRPLPGFFAERTTTLRARLDAALSEPEASRSASLRAITSEAVRTLEDAVLWCADDRAGAVRTGELEMRVVDAAGRGVAGAEVVAEQIERDFLLGVFEPLASAGDEVYARFQEAGLNVVTAGVYWNETEPVRGHVQWDHIDHAIGVRDLAARGWLVKGHPLTWLYDLAMPAWALTLDSEELEAVSVARVHELVSHYRDVVRVWDVNNESSGVHASGGLDRPSMERFLVSVFAAARAADPTATLILNNHFDRFGGARATEVLEGREILYSTSVARHVAGALAAGVDFDVVGQQMYNGGAVTFLADLGLGPVAGVPTFDLGFLEETLDELAAMGLPLHVTEVSVASAWDDVDDSAGAGYWRRPWDESVQAEWADAFYRLCFGHPAVGAITWWNATDTGAFVRRGGLVRADGSVKEALLRIEALADEWRSAVTALSDPDGTVRFRAVAGVYRVTVEGAGCHRDLEVHIGERRSTTLEIRLDGEAPPPRRASGRR